MVWTRYPQGFSTKEAAEDFQESVRGRFDGVEIREEFLPAPPEVGFNDEELPGGA